jgi:hypothetical protein
MDPNAASQSPPSAVRGAVDSIVQSSLVELFAAYDIAVAPLPRIARERAPKVPDVSAMISFTTQHAPNHRGRLTLSAPSAVLELMKDGAASTLKGDWTRELANQLLGRIKNRLLQFSVRLETGISLGADAQTVERQLQSSDTRLYAGRTLRGEILVTLAGIPHENQLTYVSAVKVAAEGEVILF